MRCSLFAITLGIVLVLTLQASASSEDVARAIRIETKAGADSVTVGERLYVSYAATYPESLTLLPPERFDTGNCRLVSVKWREDSRAEDKIKRADLVVVPMDLESARVPPAAFHFLLPTGDTLVAFSDEIEVPIRQLTSAESQPKPLKPQWEAPKSYFYYYLAGGLVLLAAIALWLWKRRRQKAPAPQPTRPEPPADYVALKALGQIESMNLLAVGEYKKYYTLVVDAVRHYLERRFDIQTMDRTTDEILYQLSGNGAGVEGLEPLLREADMVKFAKYIPDIVAGNRAIQTARDIIARTTRHPMAAAGGE